MSGNPPVASIEEFKKFAKEFAEESDRAAAILGAAKLDSLLYQVIKGKLLPSATGNDSLLDGDRALATFSARIDMAHRLGLIDAAFAGGLHLVRKIRNSCAHDPSGTSLDSGSHPDRIRELCVALRGIDMIQLLRESLFGGENTASANFRVAVAYMSALLEALLDIVTQVRGSEAMPLDMAKRSRPSPPPRMLGDAKPPG